MFHTDNNTYTLQCCCRVLPGCQPPDRIQGGGCLNSYTYNIAVETSSGTCRAHREIRESERRFVHTLKQAHPVSRRSRRLLHKHNRRLDSAKKATHDDVYHFPTEASSSEVGQTLCHLASVRLTHIWSKCGSYIMQNMVQCNHKSKYPHSL